MPDLNFRAVTRDGVASVTYDCGCPCEPMARPAGDGAPGFEHCCCGKVHFVGAGAATALASYLADRKSQRKREPDYEVGTLSLDLEGAPVEVAWAVPVEV